jgi:hypothetical protein
MGKEYLIKCQQFDTEATRQFLERCFTISAIEGGFELALRNTATKPGDASFGSWAPVVVTLEANGIYLLDTLSAPSQAATIFMQLIEFLLSRAGEITISEL